MNNEDEPVNVDKIHSARSLAEALEAHRRRQQADAAEKVKGLSEALEAHRRRQQADAAEKVKGLSEALNSYREKQFAEIKQQLDALIVAQERNTTPVVGEGEADSGAAFEFSAVGSVSQAMHTAREFDDRPVLDLITDSTPYALVALKEKAINPERFSFIRPDDFTEEEFTDVLASYSGAELLDRERKQQAVEKSKDRAESRWQTVLKFVVPIVTLLIGAGLTYLKTKPGG